MGDPIDGSYFIDRDGTHFRFILNFLRDPYDAGLPLDWETRRELVREARYYGLKELEKELLAPPKPIVVFLQQESSILDPQMQSALAGMFAGDTGEGDRQRLNLSLLLTSQDGETEDFFHDKVWWIGQVLTVIKSTEGHVFGGYFIDTMGSDRADFNNWSFGSSENFVFTLGNLTGNPIKLLPCVGADGIYLGRGGLRMGRKRNSPNHDLVAFSSIAANNTCVPTIYTNLAPGYSPVELVPGVLCGTPGNKQFTPALIEVFQVTYTYGSESN